MMELAPESNVKAMDLIGRRKLIAHHQTIHGLEYLSLTDENTLQAHFIKPDISVDRTKSLPQLTPNNVTLCVIKNGVEYFPEFVLKPHNNLFSIEAVPNMSLTDASHIRVRILINSQFVDRFYSEAEIAWSDRSGSDGGPIRKKVKKFGPLPRLDYLSKDYDSFRKLIENELMRNAPGWKETNAADMMIAISEVLAYAGDYLSYQQDVIGTEAYLETARFPVSIKRHSRLLDYDVPRRVNARTWVHIGVTADLTIPKASPLLCGGEATNLILTEMDYQSRIGGTEVIFETMHDLHCKLEFENIALYDWGEKTFVVDAGVTEVAIAGEKDLKKGHILVFTSGCGRQQPQVVRLKADAIHKTDSLSGERYTLIRWYEEDRFAGSWAAEDCVIHGNIVLADRGETYFNEKLTITDHASLLVATLGHSNIVHCEPYCHLDAITQSAATATDQDEAESLAAVRVLETDETLTEGKRMPHIAEHIDAVWLPVSDFLDCSEYARNVAIDNQENRVYIRFGDGIFGSKPSLEKNYYATYRISPPTMPKIGAGAINQLYLYDASGVDVDSIIRVHSVLVAFDKQCENGVEIARKVAPLFHWNRKNLVLPLDYIEKIREFPNVIDVGFRQSWSGSHLVNSFYVYPAGEISRHEMAAMIRTLADQKILDQRFVVDFFRPVLLQLEMTVVVEKGFYANHILIKLKSLFSDDPDTGLFARSQFTFAKPLYASELIEAAVSVTGVAKVRLTSFQPLDDYIGGGMQQQVRESIQPGEIEVIAFAGEFRRSIIEFTIKEVGDV